MTISKIDTVEYEIRYAEIRGDLEEYAELLAYRYPHLTELELLEKVYRFLDRYEA